MNSAHGHDNGEVEVLREEIAQLTRQRDELQTDMSRMVNAQLSRRVRAFHQKFGHPVNWKPQVPDDATVRFRLALIIEEVGELLEACINTESDDSFGEYESIDDALGGMLEELKELARLAPIKVKLPELIDAVEDSKYVLEGTNAVCGVNADPIATAIHDANMAKDAVYVQEKDEHKKGERIKPVKPAGWRPPDIRGLLIEQGWDPARHCVVAECNEEVARVNGVTQDRCAKHVQEKRRADRGAARKAKEPTA